MTAGAFVTAGHVRRLNGADGSTLHVGAVATGRRSATVELWVLASDGADDPPIRTARLEAGDAVTHDGWTVIATSLGPDVLFFTTTDPTGTPQRS